MSILIKGMEMPIRCCECRLSTCHSFKERPLCDVLVEYMSYGEWETKRLDNCPLIPVPPHGRLIDADAVAKMVLDSVNQEDAQGLMFTKIICKILKEAFTIIEAEGEA